MVAAPHKKKTSKLCEYVSRGERGKIIPLRKKN
jgi:hypothetical protein